MSQAPRNPAHRLTALSLASLHTGIPLLCAGLLWGNDFRGNPARAQSQTPPAPPARRDSPPPPPPTQSAPGTNLNASPAEKFRTYRLGPGDQIFVDVQRFPSASFNGAISPEGKIVMPLIGTVFLQGLTLEQARAEIRTLLNKYVVDPVVSVELLVQRPVTVTVTGEVARPGFYPLQPGVSRVSDALQIAGGATPASDLRSLRVRRTSAGGSTAEQTLDLLTPLQTGGIMPDFRLEDGDVIVVPRQDISTAQYYDGATLARSSLASIAPVAVTVTGEVGRPGFYPLSPLASRVSDALLAALGVTPASDLRAVRVRRTLGNGSVMEQTVDLLTPLETGGSLPNVRLADGDIIFVPKRQVSSAGDEQSGIIARSTLASTAPVAITITGEVVKPGYYPLNAGSYRVSDVLLFAGGTTLNADLRAVRVRRALGNGQFSEETLDLFTPLQTSGTLPDLRLATGDTVVVPRLEPGSDRGYDRRLVARSTLAKPQINVRVLNYAGGAAGTLPLPNGSSFADALNGVPLDTANLGKIALIRFDQEQGKAVTLELDGKAALKGDPSQNLLLQDNDVIVIGRNLIARIGNALNRFTQPFRDVLGFLLFFDSLRNSADNLFGPGGNNNR
ncbi:MAG: SLBB domain-containing protein [Oscillatoria princeps RMCB-10]|nr:SLBB domain-containing protein [Oscillatoria princeps RMCB-10]